MSIQACGETDPMSEFFQVLDVAGGGGEAEDVGAGTVPGVPSSAPPPAGGVLGRAGGYSAPARSSIEGKRFEGRADGKRWLPERRARSGKAPLGQEACSGSSQAAAQ